MFIKLSVIFFVLRQTLAQNGLRDWEIAVATNDRIELLQPNGSLSGEPYGHFGEFTKLKALTFDSLRHQFVVSDMDQQNDTIYTVQLTKETEITPIIEDLPDDVQGLAIDPISDVLYWTDPKNRTINYVRLNDTTYQTRILFSFGEERPQDITIDVCHQYLYWTNSDINRPTIERAKLGSTTREVLVDSGLHSPAGISIDYTSQRIYWADIKEGIYYSIESTNLEGGDREIAYEGTHCKPFGVAVDASAIYWTDANNNALWMLPKRSKEPVPKEIRKFEDKPMGVIAKNAVASLPDCERLSQAAVTYPFEEEFEEEEDSGACFNGGYLVDNVCHCLRGYVGQFCEISLCHNYCVHGECYTSSKGYPQCRCLRGFGGSRCEVDMCQGHCLNGGVCSRVSKSGEFPLCSCPEGFTGSRCEIPADFCESFCQRVGDNSQNEICKCESSKNISSLPLTAKEEFLDHFQDTTFLVLCCLVIIMFVAIIILTAYSCSLRRRPRIKKRIIVNKNVTPLTYRPQIPDQCEITIENCCNMNICETPCFEPPKLPCLQTKNDDKKKLLSNMENGEDIY